MLISKDYAILFLFTFLFSMIIIFVIASNIYANSTPLPREYQRNNNQRNNNQRNNNQRNN